MNIVVLLIATTTIGSVLSVPQHGGAPAPVTQPPTSVQCRVEYATVWDIEYIETVDNVCTTEYVEQCQTLQREVCDPTTREVCNPVTEQQWSTKYNKECHTEYENYTETVCTTKYKPEPDCQFHWEGTGNDKKWVPDQSTCVNNKIDTCEDVTKQIAIPVCVDVPKQVCVNEPRTECQNVPDVKCRSEPYQDCKCVPQPHCEPIHKKTPKRVSRSIPKKVCDGGYNGSNNNSGEPVIIVN